MVKSYLRYEERGAFGLVVSAEANLAVDSSGKLLIAGALERLAVWNVKQGQCIHALASNLPASGAKPAVTAVGCMPTSPSLVAAGYSDGSLRIWDIIKGECESSMNGHKGAVTALRYNRPGSLIATGSKDTDVIIWDAVAEAGLFRLKGHRDQVTDVVFVDKGSSRLASCSKDKTLRVWDLESQRCIQNVVNPLSPSGELWSLDVDPSELYVICGGSEPELRLFGIDAEKRDVLRYVGDVKRQGTERVVTLRFNGQGDILGCQAAGKSLELFRVNDHAEALKKAKRRKRRKREKAEKAGATLTQAEEDELEDLRASDVVRPLQIVRLKQKVRSFAFSPAQSRKGVLCTLAFSMHNNSLEVHEVESGSSSRLHSIDLPGHRSDIRSAVLSSDGTLLMTTSHNAVKIWNPSTMSSLRTIEAGYGLCGLFAPGDQHCVVGTKGGSLEVFDIRAAERSRTIEAHSGAVWSVAAMPDGTGFYSGSADKDVKFWEYGLVQENDNAAKQLTITNTETLRMEEDVLSVCLSPDAKFLALALLDSTVKIFLRHKFKFYLSLYGHKLPVLCMDISSDATLLVSGSADKNIKIWGLDFGDCHKSIFAHGDSVMGVKFVPNTHYVFSVGKDRLVKYWDADKFEHLLTLEGHHAEVWCLAISRHGDFLITGSHDRSLRRWERTDEPFFLEEEREKRLETLFDADLEDTKIEKEDLPEEGAVGLAGRKTQETVTAADSIIEALDIAEEELKRIAEHKEATGGTKFQPNIMMLGLKPSAYVLRAVSAVRPSDLEQALLMLPFSDGLKLLEHVKDWIGDGSQIETACRVVTLLLRLHHDQLVATTSARPIITRLQGFLHMGAEHLKDIFGLNLAAMGHLQQLMAESSNVLFKDAGKRLAEVRKKLAGHSDGLPFQTKEPRPKKRQKQQAESR